MGIPFVAAVLLVWWLVGDVSERGGEDFIFQIPLAQDHAVLLGLVGVVLAALVANDLRRQRDERMQARIGGVALSAIAGAIVGGGLRVLTAKVSGANIGGGATMLLGPFVVVPLIVVATLRARRQSGH